MKSIPLIRLLLVIALVIAIVAPFTFLKIEVKQNIINSVDVEKSEIETAKKITDTAKSKNKEPNKPKIIEKALHQVAIPNFAEIRDIPTKKRAFFGFIRPAVEAKNRELLAQRSTLQSFHEQVSLGLGLTDEEQKSLEEFIKLYRINKEASNLQQINDLLERVDIIPTSLVLVQAANESAWGTSRFARIGLNFFGIWCYKQGCGMVPGGRNTGARHEVAAFQSVEASVSGYFNNINKHNAYHVFRTIRSELRAQDQPLYPEILATGLLPYSERGSDYVLDITDMLRHNKRYF